jgi:hypothetical protein
MCRNEYSLPLVIILLVTTTSARQSQPAFPPSAYHLYQSHDSLAPSTGSASSGYFNPPAPVHISDAANQFRTRHPTVTTTQPQDYDDFGNLNEEAFTKSHPVIGAMLQDFVILACNMLYYEDVLHEWPNTESLRNLALKAIEILLAAHAIDFQPTAEQCKFCNLEC